MSQAADPPKEDVRLWVGRLKPVHEQEHRSFVKWLDSAEARETFRRRRLNEYRLHEQDGLLTVVMRAPHTGDPRIFIDFLRYPGMWPAFWEFVRGGPATPEDAPILEQEPRVRWRREDDLSALGGTEE